MNNIHASGIISNRSDVKEQLGGTKGLSIGIEAIHFECASLSGQAKLYVKVQEVDPHHNKLGFRYKSTITSGVKGPQYTRFNWTVQNTWTLTKSTLLVKIMRHYVFQSDQVVATASLHLGDVITDLLQNSCTTYHITSKSDYNISMNVQQSTLQDLLEQVQSSAIVLQSFIKIKALVDSLLALGSAFGDLVLLVQPVMESVSKLHSEIQTPLVSQQVVQLFGMIVQALTLIQNVEDIIPLSLPIQRSIKVILECIQQGVAILQIYYNKHEKAQHLALEHSNEVSQSLLSIKQAICQLDGTTKLALEEIAGMF
ncbi:hypothetical protein BDN72DRAFT_960219 [Pluteus cervinus]|uniref:Uncharacterized protein n=1 Tax=Pluteus cervinus TaxID=181527 RepID=A0ACD3AU40_9AGAR|nr:hypothetical protein BDN72DRAFT_960219 [Pluteus cervinus]